MNHNNIKRLSKSIRASFGWTAGNQSLPANSSSLPQLAAVKNRLWLASPILFLLGSAGLVMAQQHSPSRLPDINPMRGESGAATSGVPLDLRDASRPLVRNDLPLRLFHDQSD
ncbi:hypothetical protein [Rhodopirellula europaea]|uniref:hypothetical protein n=1 Tax=Rhodopirellula europaea TaxID=1263866 RepID=UPI003D2682C4|tara:strand:+ start:4437 stop:4775 length:339 start_codon:yes stop_codon:yes gene_type:complete